MGFGDLSSNLFGIPILIKISNYDVLTDSTNLENKALAHLVNCWVGDNTQIITVSDKESQAATYFISDFRCFQY